MKIAFLQILPGKDLEENLTIGQNACREAKEKGADIALFPEMWSDGYSLPQEDGEIQKLAIDKESDFINAFRDLAKELEMAIGITFLEANDPRPLNSVVIFDRLGNEILHYSKVHICAFDDEKVLDSGEDFYTADLDFGRGTVKIGSMICFDREFSESARILMLKGAELILAPNACPMEINRLAALRSRAYENMVAVATCNYPEGQPDCNGHSTLFDGVPWLPDEPGVRDMCVMEAPGAPGVYIAELDLDILRTHRKNDVMGDKYRHPDKYKILLDEKESGSLSQKGAGEEGEAGEEKAEKSYISSVFPKAQKENGAFGRKYHERLLQQLSLDYNCTPDDLTAHENIITVSEMRDGRRIYSRGKPFLQMVTIGGNTVIMADECLHDFLKGFVRNVEGHHLFEFDYLTKLNEELKKYGYQMNPTHHMFLPSHSVRVEEKYPVKWFYDNEIDRFYGDKRFPNAISFPEPCPVRPDRIVVTAVEGDTIMGMTGCSEDAPHWQQIGIDVMPEYRSKGIGTYLVSLLTNRVLEMGDVPFYGTAAANTPSQNIALNCGFRPAWVETEAVKIES